MKQSRIENKHEEADESKAAVRPHTYEMRHYPHDGLLEQLAFMLIRPPRFVYNPDILRPPKRAAHRFTAEILNAPFELTFYRQQTMDYVILYLHGNGSSSFEGTLFLNYLPDRVGLACFDFRGCGNRSEGDFITLGQEEARDVDVAANFLKAAGHRVVGWGRSMGAVSLLMSEQCDVMVADSAYSNLAVLCKESSAKFLPRACCCLFNCLFPCVFACIQCKVESLAGLEISRMDVTARLQQLPPSKQICFIHGEEDVLVPAHHSQQLYGAFTGRKELLMFEGTHNSIRPKEVLQKCFEFIEEGLRREAEAGEGNARLLAMEVEMQSLPVSRQEPKIQQKLELLEPSPLHQRKILEPISKKSSSPQKHHSPNASKPNPPPEEEYCEIGAEARLPANETLAEEEPF